jgi:hypothetical protein
VRLTLNYTRPAPAKNRGRCFGGIGSAPAHTLRQSYPVVTMWRRSQEQSLAPPIYPTPSLRLYTTPVPGVLDNSQVSSKVSLRFRSRPYETKRAAFGLHSYQSVMSCIWLVGIREITYSATDGCQRCKGFRDRQ